jgi:hypothetical protein
MFVAVVAAGIFPRIGAIGSRGKLRSTVDIGRISAIRRKWAIKISAKSARATGPARGLARKI